MSTRDDLGNDLDGGARGSHRAVRANSDIREIINGGSDPKSFTRLEESNQRLHRRVRNIKRDLSRDIDGLKKRLRRFDALHSSLAHSRQEQEAQRARTISLEKKLLAEIQGLAQQYLPMSEARELAGYNQLRTNIIDSVKHVRNQMLILFVINGYGLISVIKTEDLDFFVRDKRKFTLAFLSLDISLAWYLPAIALLSFLFFIYFHFYLQHTWTIVDRARHVAEEHRTRTDFVPMAGPYLYPWIAFAARERGAWGYVASGIFGIVQWFLTPALLVACCARTIRLGSNLNLWFSAKLPPVWPFCIATAVTLTMVAYLAHRSHVRRGTPFRGPRSWVFPVGIQLSALVCIGWSYMHPLQLKGAEMQGAHLPEAVLTAAQLHKAQLEKANLNGAGLEHAALVAANLADAELIGASLSHSDLQDANLRSAHISDADLRGADLRGADLAKAELVRTNLRGANLRAADLDGAILTGADLRGANLFEAKGLLQNQLDRACTDDETKLPTGLTTGCRGDHKRPD